jgi:hypothetical protein
MPTVHVKSEVQMPRGWKFAVEIGEGSRMHGYEVTLSWSDYDLWSHGRVGPERVVKAAFEFLLQREPAGEILSKFDCAAIRRFFTDVDRELPKLI